MRGRDPITEMPPDVKAALTPNQMRMDREHVDPVDRQENAEAAGDHVVFARQEIRKAVAAVEKAARGTLVDVCSVGLDPSVRDPTKRWWAKARLSMGRAGRTVYATEHPSAVSALEELARNVAHSVRRR